MAADSHLGHRRIILMLLAASTALASPASVSASASALESSSIKVQHASIDGHDHTAAIQGHKPLPLNTVAWTKKMLVPALHEKLAALSAEISSLVDLADEIEKEEHAPKNVIWESEVAKAQEQFQAEVDKMEEEKAAQEQFQAEVDKIEEEKAAKLKSIRDDYARHTATTTATHIPLARH